MSMRTKQTGLSLIELMVASTIGLLLLLGVTSIAINSSRAHKEISALSQQLENGRYAVQLITNELKHAGFYGRLFGAIPTYSGTSLPDPCTLDPSVLLGHLELAVQGYDGPADASALACLSNANYKPFTDILVVRRAETKLADPNSLDIGEVYIQALPNDRVIDKGENAASFNLKMTDGVTPADIRKYRVDIYFVSPCSLATDCTASADGGNPIPTLKRLELTQVGGTTRMRTVPLVEGIDDLQIDWGIDHSGDGAPNETDPGVSGDDYRRIPLNIDEWKNVVALYVHVLARNIQSSPGYTDQKTYSFGESGTQTPGGDFKRHLYSSVVRLMNVSSRREGS